MLEPVEHACLESGVDLPERHRRRCCAHESQAFGDDLVGQGSDAFAGQVRGRVDRRFAQDAARTEIIGPADDLHVGAGFQRLLERLGRAGVKRLGLLRETFEQIAEIEQADQRHDVRPDRSAGDHQVDHAETDGIDDVDLLAELIVGKELHLDAVGEAMGREALDEIVVVNAAVGELRIVRQ